MSDYVMRQATENDLRAIEILLEANDLPNIHLAPYIKQFMVVENDDNVLIGVIGLHTTGKKALLRSLFRYRDETVELGLCWCSMYLNNCNRKNMRMFIY